MSRTHAEHALLTAGLAAIAFVLLYRVGLVPHVWFDEGAHMHVAKNLASTGVYADYSSEGNRYTGPVLGVGPTVVLPIALLFKVFGADILLGRLIIVLYAIGAVVAMYALCRSLGGRLMGVISVGLLLSLPEFAFYARSVLGEIPGAFFVLTGLWWWLKPQQDNPWRFAIAGVLFGLASITKNQYALVVLPALLLTWLLDLAVYRMYRWQRFVLPGMIAGLIYASWTYFVLFVLGSSDRNVAEDFETLRATSSYALFDLDPQNLKILWWAFPIYTLLCLAASPFWARRVLQRNSDGYRWAVVGAFAAMAGLMFLTSLGWTRYAVPVLILTVPIAALVLREAAGGFAGIWAKVPLIGVGGQRLLRTVGVTFVAGSLAVGASLEAFAMLRRGGHEDAYAMADRIEHHVPPAAVIETLEQEFAILTDHTFHYPPQRLIVDLTAEWIRRERTHGASYDEIPYVVEWDYVLSRTHPRLSADFYSHVRLADFEMIAAAGTYELYRRKGTASSSAR